MQRTDIKKKQLIVLSLDYDNCCDHLFDIDYDFFNDKQTAKFKRFARQIIEQVLLSELHEIVNRVKKSKSNNDVDMILLVGSARQDINTDEHGMAQCHNGSCFANYKKLCREQRWELDPFLLADSQNPVAPGTAMQDRSITVKSWDKGKVSLLAAQIKYLKRRYDGYQLSFHFIDDDCDGLIFPSLRSKLPESIKWDIKEDDSLEFIRFNKDRLAHEISSRYLHSSVNQDQVSIADVNVEELKQYHVLHSSFKIKLSASLSQGMFAQDSSNTRPEFAEPHVNIQCARPEF